MIIDKSILLKLANQAMEQLLQKEEVKAYTFDQVERAMTHWENNNNEEAIKSVSNALSVFPEINFLLIFKSLLYCSSKNTIQSNKILDSISNENLTLLELNLKQFIRSCNCFHDHDYNGAINFTTQIISKNRKAYYAYLPRALSYAELNLHKDAIINYKKALKENEQTEGIKASLAFSYMKNKRFIKALILHLKVIKHFSENFRVNYNLGVNYFMLNLNSLALKHINKSIELKSDFADAYRSKGLVFLNQGKKELAYENLILAKKYGAINIDKTLKRFEQKLK